MGPVGCAGGAWAFRMVSRVLAQLSLVSGTGSVTASGQNTVKRIPSAGCCRVFSGKPDRSLLSVRLRLVVWCESGGGGGLWAHGLSVHYAVG